MQESARFPREPNTNSTQVTANMEINELSEDRELAIAREIAKEVARRKLADAHWTQRDLLQIFALGLAHRLRTYQRDTNQGKNYFSSRFHAGARNPAGSKLLRRFIRTNAARSASYEDDYKALTGRRYNHVNLGEDDAEAVV